MWRILFVMFSTAVLYFGYGVASHGGPGAFFAGALVGCIITYLFMRYRKEKIENRLKAQQTVTVNVAQNVEHHALNAKVADMSVLDLIDLLDSVQQKKLLLSQHGQSSQSIPQHSVIDSPYGNSVADALASLRAQRALNQDNGVVD